MRQIGLRALPQRSLGLTLPSRSQRRGCVIRKLGAPFVITDFPAQRDFVAGVRSVARYVPPSDARIVQEYRLAA
jgi:hypothetical protein